MTFATVLASARPLDGGFALTVTDDWLQGRTAFGGLTAALAYEVAKRAGGEGLPPLRSAHIAFVGPLSGEVEFRPRVLRRGRNATWIAVELSQNDAVGMTATFVFMGPVEDSVLHHDAVRPPAGYLAPEQAAPVPDVPETPVFFASHIEARHAVPQTGSKRPEVDFWVRIVGHDEMDPMAAILLVADSPPPAVIAMMGKRVPLSSMLWQVNVLSPVPATRDGWWLCQSAGDYAERGCSSERLTVWNADGEPMITGVQSVAIFG